MRSFHGAFYSYGSTLSFSFLSYKNGKFIIGCMTHRQNFYLTIKEIVDLITVFINNMPYCVNRIPMLQVVKMPFLSPYLHTTNVLYGLIIKFSYFFLSFHFIVAPVRSFLMNCTFHHFFLLRHEFNYTATLLDLHPLKLPGGTSHKRKNSIPIFYRRKF